MDEFEVEIPASARLLVKDGTKVQAGEQLTEGSLNPHRILRILGREACELYLLSEVQKVYRSQGQNINDKHFEVIIRKMMSKVQVTRPGDTNYLPGDHVDRLEIKRINERGLPILVGTVSVEVSETLSRMLTREGIPHSVLNAKYHQREAEIVAHAGLPGMITIATNMAGRGTDIKLGPGVRDRA